MNNVTPSTEDPAADLFGGTEQWARRHAEATAIDAAYRPLVVSAPCRTASSPSWPIPQYAYQVNLYLRGEPAAGSGADCK